MTQEKEPVYGDKIAIERNKRAYLLPLSLYWFTKTFRTNYLHISTIFEDSQIGQKPLAFDHLIRSAVFVLAKSVLYLVYLGRAYLWKLLHQQKLEGEYF